MRKMTAWLAVVLLMAAGVTVSGASPAQAASWTDCPSSATHSSGFVCLWEGKNYTGGRWQQNKSLLAQGTAGDLYGCWNLTDSKFTNGTVVYDKASSWAIRAAETDIGGYYVTFYAWVGCAGGQWRKYVPNKDYAVSDLSTLNPDWDNTVASVYVSDAP